MTQHLARIRFADGLTLLGLYDAQADSIEPSLVRPMPDITGRWECCHIEPPDCRERYERAHRVQHGCAPGERMKLLWCQALEHAASRPGLLQEALDWVSQTEPVEVEVPACHARWRSHADRSRLALVGVLEPLHH
ncbi:MULTISPECIES: hypothetical protein [Caldimonas]|uniref:hypothetical protein n=1 Tax=Caldimonas TaxID=196013 RepID=UPI0007864E3D|nr:hypothetical protein [Caldimonas taiwanensis]MCX7660762.1 hypothetical protein [Caldimonas manganoxidans]GIX22889.1 MAG: hypothetical protein KatS3mg122_0120 [Caldimonas sp.]